jgi:hypothetical protein
VTLLFIIYGIICIPVYWLQRFSSHNFQVLSGLPIAFSIITSILIAILNIYVPYCMGTASAEEVKPVREEGTYISLTHLTYAPYSCY